jgi:uncharacterized protein
VPPRPPPLGETPADPLPQNKDKKKKGTLPTEMTSAGRYLAARTVGDAWINYPWEAVDIDEHDRQAVAAVARGRN